MADELALVQEHCGIGRSRAYEYLSIAEGKKTADSVRGDTNARKVKHRENPFRNGLRPDQ